ncbi:MAG: MFS transporter [Candidatus Aureabacteria bacterium]|nr:MFS transporter [Candidatus Auribacterota bacterium]
MVNLKRLITPKKLKVYLLSAGHLIHDIYTSFLSPVLPLLIEKFSLTYTLAACLRLAMRIPSILNPFIGHIADGVGLKYFVALAPAITAIAMSLIGKAPNYLSLVILLIVTGLSSSFFHVPAPVILKRISGRKLGMSMSGFQIGGELSRTIGPIIVVGAISLWGFAGIYRLMPLGIVVSIVLLLKLKDEKIPRHRSKKYNFKKSITKTLKQGKMLIFALLGIVLVKSFTASVTAAFLPTYLSFKGYSLWIAGGALSILQAAAIIGVLLTGIISDIIGRKRLLIIVTFCSPLAMLLFLIGVKHALIPVVILLGLISFSSTPVVLALIQENDFKYPSIANGIYLTINFLLSSIIVLFFGKVSDIFGMEKAFFISGICSFLGLPLVFFIPGDKKDSITDG